MSVNRLFQRIRPAWVAIGIALGGALGGAAGARAQAPVITAQGDPSVANDTIYRLAVDSAAHPRESMVLLLDDGVVRVEADGRSSRTWRQAVEILRVGAVANYQEMSFSYSPDRESLVVNWIHVVGRDGHLISDKAAQLQESDVAASMVNPVYQREKVVRASLTGVAPGTIVDYSYTTVAKEPYRKGDFYQTWSISAGTTVRRSRFLLDAPADLHLLIAEHHLHVPRRETRVGDRTVYVWAASDVPYAEGEMFQPPADSNDQVMSLDVATPGHWSDVGEWYAGLAHDRVRASSALRDSVHRVVAGATSRDDSIRAIHRWVSQDIRYVSVSLGLGGYQPRAPDTVLATGFGDCKDKATLLIAALSVVGVDAYPVLINALGNPDRALPTIGAFNHLITAIPNGAKYQFVDPTSDLTPFGQLPYSDAGKFVLVVHPDGRTEELTTPSEPPGTDRTETSFAGRIDTSGVFDGTLVVRGYGISDLSMRNFWREPRDSAQLAALERKMAASLFPGSTSDSLHGFDGKDFRQPAVVSARVHGGQATQHSGTSDILSVGDRSARFLSVANELTARLPRQSAIDVGAVVGPVETRDEFVAILPEGWRAKLPPDVNATSIFGSYSVTYRQDGRRLAITHHLTGATGIVGKEHVDELIAWLRAAGKDRVPFIIIDHDAPPTS
jgi:transglutaminase-like putative cysteine protease